MTEDPSATGGADAWERTIEELRALAADLREDGWEVVDIPAGHTAPEPPEAGEDDRYGLVYTIPGEEAERFETLYERGDYAEYEVYRREAGGDLFLVTRFSDRDRRLAILLAGAVELGQAERLIEVARERDELFTHVQLLDWTHLGSFTHADPGLFFPAE